MANLKIALGDIELKKPIILASGTAGHGEISDFFDQKNVGAIALKAVSMKKRTGNMPPRIVETPAGVLNAIGLANEGIDHFEKSIIPKLKKIRVPLIANVVGDTADEYAAVVKRLTRFREIAAFELNVSCPNVHGKNKLFFEDNEVLKKMIASCKKATKKTIIVKLPPAVFGIEELAKTAADSGADIISLTNTIPAMEIDIRTERPMLGNNQGGLSGAAIRPIALRLVYRASKAVSIPIIGGGGVSNADDVVKFMLAGATAVSIGTASMITPNLPDTICRDLDRIIDGKNMKNIADLTGRLTLNSQK
ncbi:MAG: dihydroorotate dehydrogenase [Spirochaetota bacterium]